ncbi:MAG: EamA family transporter [Candidatus Omnitrophica bacterium]|nr:EamA family transporter [Candidatus Omnitrophota bacterium]
MQELFLSWGLLVISVVFNVYGVFVIKLKLNELGPVKTESFKAVFSYFCLLLKSPLVLSGVVVFFLAPFLFAMALSRMQIAIAYPVQIGLNFILLILLAVIFLGEHLTLYKILGMILIFSGVYFLNKG